MSGGRAQRKPIVPPHLRNGDGLAGLYRGVRRHLHHRAAEHGHRAAYHAMRAPRYIALHLGWAIVGFFRVTGRVLAWWHATDLHRLEHQAAADGLLTDHLRLHRQGRETRTARGIMIAVAAFVLLLLVVAAVRFMPWLLAVAAVLPYRHGLEANAGDVAIARLLNNIVGKPEPGVFGRYMNQARITEIPG